MPTVKELKKMCKEKGIKGYSRWKKAELMENCYDTPKPKTPKRKKRKIKTPKPEKLSDIFPEQGIVNIIDGYVKDMEKLEIIEKSQILLDYLEEDYIKADYLATNKNRSKRLPEITAFKKMNGKFIPAFTDYVKNVKVFAQKNFKSINKRISVKAKVYRKLIINTVLHSMHIQGNIVSIARHILLPIFKKHDKEFSFVLKDIIYWIGDISIMHLQELFIDDMIEKLEKTYNYAYTQYIYKLKKQLKNTN